MIRSAVMMLVAVGGCVGMPRGLGAAVVSLTPSQDNTLYEDTGGGLSNGAGEWFFAGSSLTSLTRRGLVAFDVAVPAGSTITSVRLSLHMSRTVAGTETVGLHRVLAAWGEGTSVAFGEGGGGAPATAGDATWLHTFYPGQFWGAPGGDFAAAASASVPVGGIAFYTWESTAGLVADVQSWLDSPGSNFGWLLRCNESIDGTAKRFDSRENRTAAFRPVLTITFAPPCPADYNGDGFVDGIDSDQFNNDFEAGDMAADFNGDGFVDGIDADQFNNHFDAGC